MSSSRGNRVVHGPKFRQQSSSSIKSQASNVSGSHPSHSGGSRSKRSHRSSRPRRYSGWGFDSSSPSSIESASSLTAPVDWSHIVNGGDATLMRMRDYLLANPWCEGGEPVPPELLPSVVIPPSGGRGASSVSPSPPPVGSAASSSSDGKHHPSSSALPPSSSSSSSSSSTKTGKPSTMAAPALIHSSMTSVALDDEPSVDLRGSPVSATVSGGKSSKTRVSDEIAPPPRAISSGSGLSSSATGVTATTTTGPRRGKRPDLAAITVPKSSLSVGSMSDSSSVPLTAHRYRTVDSLTDPEKLSALHVAIRSGDLEIMEMLREMEANLDVREGQYGETPLHFAMRAGFKDGVRWLIAWGANCDLLDYEDNPARYYGDTDIMQVYNHCLSVLDSLANEEGKRAESIDKRELLRRFGLKPLKTTSIGFLDDHISVVSAPYATGTPVSSVGSSSGVIKTVSTSSSESITTTPMSTPVPSSVIVGGGTLSGSGLQWSSASASAAGTTASSSSSSSSTGSSTASVSGSSATSPKGSGSSRRRRGTGVLPATATSLSSSSSGSSGSLVTFLDDASLLSQMSEKWESCTVDTKKRVIVGAVKTSSTRKMQRTSQVFGKGAVQYLTEESLSNVLKTAARMLFRMTLTTEASTRAARLILEIAAEDLDSTSAATSSSSSNPVSVQMLMDHGSGWMRTASERIG